MASTDLSERRSAPEAANGSAVPLLSHRNGGGPHLRETKFDSTSTAFCSENSGTSAAAHPRESSLPNGGARRMQHSQSGGGGGSWSSTGFVQLTACTAAGVVFGFAAEKAKGMLLFIL